MKNEVEMIEVGLVPPPWPVSGVGKGPVEPVGPDGPIGGASAWG